MLQQQRRAEDRLIEHPVPYVSPPFLYDPVSDSMREGRITSIVDLFPSLCVPADKHHKSKCITETEGEIEERTHTVSEW
jgi:hypothetical protein